MNDTASSAALRQRLGDAVLGTVSDAIVYTDCAGVIRHWNPGAERIFGFTAAEAVGRSVDLIIPEPQRARHWAGFRKVMDTGESRYGQGDILAVPGLRKDGTRVSLEFTIVPIHADDGRMEGMIAIMRDVTRRFEEMRALKRENAALRERPEAVPAQQSV